VTPLRILIVEDNRINRIVLRDLLARDGHAVDEAHDGQQGLDRVRRTSYDIVFMDISMPVMDGVEATRAIRKSEARGTRIPLIALTAHARTADKERFRAAGLDDILVKPITRDGLRAIIAKFCKPGGVAEVAAQAPSPDAALVDPGQPSVRVARAPVLRQRPVPAFDQRLDRVGQVDLVDMVIAARHADLVRLDHHVGLAVAFGRHETVARQFDPKAQRVAEIDRVHEAPVDRPGMGHAARVQPLGHLPELAWLTFSARWCSEPVASGTGVASGLRSSLVKMVISRPSPGSK
jgi:CheY-like chemotaxis protein